MPARAPLDVDLEDKLLYGLTPTRLAYLVISLLAGFVLWSSHWAPVPIRAVASLLVIGTGAAVSWGRWKDRAADAWAVDIVAFAMRTRRITWNERLLRCLKKAMKRGDPASPDADAVGA
ncbi:MAG: hypothetical protein ABI334_04225 [Candidatus Dormiibacterota bacterium]